MAGLHSRLNLACFALALILASGCSDSTGPSSQAGDDEALLDAAVDPAAATFVVQASAFDPDSGLYHHGRFELIGSGLVTDPALETVSFDVAIRNNSEDTVAVPLIAWIGRLRPATVVPLNADVEDTLQMRHRVLRFGFDYSALVGEDALLEPGETSGARTWTFHDPGLAPFTFAARVEVGRPVPPLLGPHIAGRVFQDVNRNGLSDSGEPGLHGVVLLTTAGGDTVAAHPNRTGHYAFAIESAGLYTLRYGSRLDWPAECFTTPNPLEVLVVPGPDSQPQSIDGADFGISPRPCHGAIAPAVMIASPLEEIPQDSYTLLELHLRGDILMLKVGVSGCGPDHPFTLFVSSNFMESRPVQTVALLAHDDLDEMCDGYFERTLAFDLAPLRQAYIEAYGHPGEVVLRFRDFAGEERRVRFGP